MTANALDLWPAEFQVAPLTPLRVLQLQRELLSQKTGGRLRAEIATANKGSPVRTPDEWTGPEEVHKFEIVAPALNDYRHQLLVCVHQRDFAYPCLVISDPDPDTDGVEASTQEEFLQLVKKVLSSKSTRALIESLLVRIAEAKAAPVPA
jgi:hypothetical protein